MQSAPGATHCSNEHTLPASQQTSPHADAIGQQTSSRQTSSSSHSSAHAGAASLSSSSSAPSDESSAPELEPASSPIESPPSSMLDDAIELSAHPSASENEQDRTPAERVGAVMPV